MNFNIAVLSFSSLDFFVSDSISWNFSMVFFPARKFWISSEISKSCFSCGILITVILDSMVSKSWW